MSSRDKGRYRTVQTSMLDSSVHSQSKADFTTVSPAAKVSSECTLTLFAGFVFNFSKILCDWTLVARPLILSTTFINTTGDGKSDYESYRAPCREVEGYRRSPLTDAKRNIEGHLVEIKVGLLSHHQASPHDSFSATGESPPLLRQHSICAPAKVHRKCCPFIEPYHCWTYQQVYGRW